ncbi:apolipoprotein N-acyltransferase [Deinococcus piscis]|uniref:Apolipoprotein N-acyltransferase n=1 Tax=Deinococcus piscis TaxID=394230 RepID=A0ABQ3K9U4_9DEIO|nr:apolipoprotein N-acyltransferase [Deinococcus piscis]GHG06441.1 apolipoprotein N-acyltransferase [Deinococcus piscis]
MPLSPHLRTLTAGLLTGLATLTPAAPLAVLPLAVWLALAAEDDTARRMGWGAFGYVGAHLWWVMVLAAQVFGVAPAGLLALVLYAIEGLFFAALGWAVLRLFHTPRRRLWALAGGWVLLEYLRTLGTLAFPWPTLGMVWLETPLIQIADLGGVLLASWLAVTVAAALADWQSGHRRPLALSLGLLALASAYGLSRSPAEGPSARAYLTRTDVDSFSRLEGGALLPSLLEASAGRAPDEPVIWSETALQRDLNEEALFPGPGISGAGLSSGGLNTVIALDSRNRVVGENHKGRPVPFGETFPFQFLLRPLYTVLGTLTGFNLTTSVQPAQKMVPLDLNGIRYGAYVCYDSVFAWPARQLTRQGAEVLVNVSNDSWYAATGVRQHFDLGRVRAIENRRWVLRAVQRGWAGSVDDLGRPQQVLRSGQGGLSVEYRRLSGQTLYSRLGDLPALTLAGGLLLLASGLRPGAARGHNTPHSTSK